MRALVTGGAGYIGSETAKVLANAGHEPVVLDNLSTGHRWAVKWGPFVEGDLADAELLRRTLSDYRIEAVLHFAAVALVGESLREPRKYFRNNMANTLNLLEAMLDTGVNRLVFSSSAATYGDPQKIPIPENHPQLPVNPYGESKLMVERALKWYGQAYGLGWISLRYFNSAGAGDSELGEDHEIETHLIPLTIQATLGRRLYVEIYGADYPTPDGTAIRDYVHVTDLAEAHVLALEHLTRGGESQALNLGTGQGHSVREVIGAVGKVAARAVPVREGPRRGGDPPVLVADACRAATLLGWKPRFPELDAIVESAWHWHVASGR
jgi:UDP-glucose-4-epimerase GalE